MKPALICRSTVALGTLIVTLVGWRASAEGDRVRFPDRYREGLHYTTVTRGNIREELFTTPAAIEAAKAGTPFPDGTVITMEDYRDGKLYRYIVMEKQPGWGASRPPETRNGDWAFQAFNADRTVNRAETLDRCFACHKSQAADDFVFTRARMKSAP